MFGSRLETVSAIAGLAVKTQVRLSIRTEIPDIES